MNGHWDHKTKPSTFVVFDNGKEVYRGPFEAGHKLLNKQRNYKNEVSKYFNEPEPQQTLQKDTILDNDCLKSHLF